VIVDRGAGVVRILRPRYPFGVREDAIDIEHVKGAVVEETESDGSPLYRVALVRVDGSTVPVTRSASNVGRTLKEDAVAQIEEALARRA
jgi:hypothetical protein